MSDWVMLQNALGLTLRPIDVWPGVKPRRQSFNPSPYSAPLKDTLSVLKLELRELRAKNVVLQIDLRESDFRLDGLPRAGALAKHPGIVLAFDSKQGPLRLYFDGFGKYEHNLRAIAIHLADLRHASLYGVGADGQQYAGWKALPPPEPDGFASVSAAASFIARSAGVSHAMQAELAADPETLAYYYRLAAKQLHPDQGGDHENFVRLQQAKSILDDYQKGRA